MLRRTRSVLFAAGLLAPALVLGGHSAAAAAVDQDLVLSVTNGPPGTEVTASSASCVSDFDGDVDRYLRVLLISGTAPNELLAGIGISFGFDDSPATLTVPDWVDDSAPAVIEAECVTYSWYDDVETTEPYDPVSFDIEPGTGPVTQTRTISRTELLAGQALSVSATGCTDGEYGGVAVFQGRDLSGRTFDQSVTEGGAEIVGGTFEAEAVLSNAGTTWSASTENGGPVIVDDLTEIPNDIPPGPYTVVAFCGGEDGTSVVYEATVIEITGSAPTNDLDLTSPAGSRDVSLAGGSCTDNVVAGFSATDLDTLFGDWGDGSGGGGSGGRSRLEARPKIGRRPAITRGSLRSPGTASRRAQSSSVALMLDDDGFTFLDATPDADGFWATDDSISFDHGVVYGFATCGDPLADGFVYDPQLVEVKAAIEPPPTTTTTTTTPNTPTSPVAPPPAVAVAAVPKYAG